MQQEKYEASVKTVGLIKPVLCTDFALILAHCKWALLLAEDVNLSHASWPIAYERLARREQGSSEGL